MCVCLSLSACLSVFKWDVCEGLLACEMEDGLGTILLIPPLSLKNFPLPQR